MPAHRLIRACRYVTGIVAIARVTHAQPAAATLGFENAVGGRATGWTTAGGALYDIGVDSVAPFAGKYSLRSTWWGGTPFTAGTGIFGVASVSMPLGAFAGRRAHLTGYVRTEGIDAGYAGLWMRIDGPGNSSISIDNMAGRGIRGTTPWTRCDIELAVDSGAAQIVFGAIHPGNGTAWFDSLTVTPVGPAMPRTIAVAAPTLAPGLVAGPRPLTARGLDNLVALTRVVGVVRHFHPTEAVRTANWDDIILRGIRAAEDAPTPDSLARAITRVLAPVAPTALIYVTGMRPPVMAVTRADTMKSPGVMWWANIGLLLAPPSPTFPSAYSSNLRVTPAPAGRIPNQIALPDSAWRANLPGGVSAIVPISRWVDLGLTGPAPPTPAPVAPASPTEPISPRDRTTHIAAVIEAWNVYQHSYPYLDILKIDWAAALRRALTSSATDATAEAFLATLERLVADARDGHGRVIGPPVAVRQGSLPVALGWVEHHLVVTRVGAGAPPEIHRGDVIEKWDGVAVDSVMARHELLISGATPQWKRYRAVNELLLGGFGRSVALSLGGNGGPREAHLTYGSASVVDSLPDKITDVAPGVIYVDISRITDADFTALLPRLTQARGIVFDLRGYPSGNTLAILPHLSGDTVRSAHFEVPTFMRPDQQGVRWEDGGWTLPPVSPHLTAKVAWITSGGAISYAESTLGVVEGCHLGDIVGEPTAGTNGNINPFRVIGGYQIIYTGMRVTKLDGTPHHGVGIKPTVPVSRTIQGVAAGRDEMLERAIATVQGR